MLQTKLALNLLFCWTEDSKYRLRDDAVEVVNKCNSLVQK